MDNRQVKAENMVEDLFREIEKKANTSEEVVENTGMLRFENDPTLKTVSEISDNLEKIAAQVQELVISKESAFDDFLTFVDNIRNAKLKNLDA